MNAPAVLAEVAAHLPRGDLLVALSGGADSAVLAWAAVETSGSSRVAAVHVNHGQPASQELENAARAIAARLEIPFSVVAVVPGAGSSFENRARNVRLAALEEAAGPDEVVLLGHQRDDVVETVIANLGRGAGARGLSGIAERRGCFVRPLLGVDRESVRSLATELDLPYRDDPANRDERHQRNAIRSEVVPVLEKVIGDGVRERISRAAGHLAADDATLEAEAASVPIRIGYRGVVLIPRAPLAILPPAVATRVVQRALRTVHPPYGGSADDVAAVLNVADGEVRRAVIGGDLVAETEFAGLVIRAQQQPAQVPSPVPVAEDAAGPITFGPVQITVGGANHRSSIGRSSARLVAGPWEVRAATAGERIEMTTGSKLVRDAMAEAWIPSRLRSEWPVVAQHERIGWIAGSRVAPWAQAEPQNSRVLAVTMERIAL